MGVAAWGYGTGATSSAAHPFSLTIQGVDVIGWVPIESVRIDQAVDSNATLEFDMVDGLAAYPITPFAYADIVLTDHTNGDVLFTGVVMGWSRVRLAVGSAQRIRCVDYGILIDKCPMMRGVIVGVGTAPLVSTVVGAIMGQAATGPITAAARVDGGSVTAWGKVVGEGPSPAQHWDYVADDAGTGDALMAGNVRANLESVAERVVYNVWAGDDTTVAPLAVYVDPYRRLVVMPGDTNWENGPGWAILAEPGALSASVVAPEFLSIDYDYDPLAAGVFVTDDNTSSGGDNSAFYVHDTTRTNGYFVCSESTSAPLASAADVPVAGQRYIAASGRVGIAVEAVVTVTNSPMLGSIVALKYATADNVNYVVTAMGTEFYPGTSGKRRLTLSLTQYASGRTKTTQGATRRQRRDISRASTGWNVTA